MPDPQPPKPTPLKRFALQRPPLAPPGTVRIDAAPPPPNFSPWQLWGQGLLEGVVDPIRGALWGATGPEDTLAARGGETVMAGLPLLGGVRDLMAGRGLYSRVDEALKLLPKKGAHPNKVLSILKNNASTEELAYRGVPEFLASKGNATVTPADLAAHLAAHPAPLPVVKTLAKTPDTVTNWLERNNQGIPQTPEEWTHLSAQLERTAQGWQRNGDPETANRFFGFAEDAGRHAEGVSTTTGSTAGQPKFSQYTLPGGEGYRETLVTLPTKKAPSDFELQSAFTQANEDLNAFRRAHPDAEFGYGPDSVEYRRLVMARNRLGGQLTASENAQAATQFRSGHFEEPNILVHTRANERTLPTGERGRFVEEVQSDWHQQGKQKGYGPEQRIVAYYEVANGGIVPVGYGKTEAAALADVDPKWKDLVTVKTKTETLGPGGPPDAPFKESWPDLGLKQQVLETAADPDAQWIGFTSGQTQAARYDLSKQISRVEFDAGDRQLRAFDHHGDEVIRQTTDADHLGDYLGKEAAEKLLASTPSLHPDDQTPLYSLQGVDLQVGGEGMRHFYDQVLPKRLEKIVKPFGGTVERAPLGGRTKAAIDAEMDAILERASASEGTITERYSDEVNRQLQILQAERNKTSGAAPAWIAKLTPEMKARILKEGLPLLSLTAFLSQMGQPKPKEGAR